MYTKEGRERLGQNITFLKLLALGGSQDLWTEILSQLHELVETRFSALIYTDDLLTNLSAQHLQQSWRKGQIDFIFCTEEALNGSERLSELLGQNQDIPTVIVFKSLLASLNRLQHSAGVVLNDKSLAYIIGEDCITKKKSSSIAPQPIASVEAIKLTDGQVIKPRPCLVALKNIAQLKIGATWLGYKALPEYKALSLIDKNLIHSLRYDGLRFFLVGKLPVHDICGLASGQNKFEYVWDRHSTDPAAKATLVEELTKVAAFNCRSLYGLWMGNTFAYAAKHIPLYLCDGTLSAEHAQFMHKKFNYAGRILPLAEFSALPPTAGLVVRSMEHSSDKLLAAHGLTPIPGLIFNYNIIAATQLLKDEQPSNPEHITEPSVKEFLDRFNQQQTIERRLKLLKQEQAVSEQAASNLKWLSQLNWRNKLPADAERKPILVAGINRENDFLSMQSLPRGAKKRWLDVLELDNADIAQTLTPEILNDYVLNGTIIASTAARKNLGDISYRTEQKLLKVNRQYQQLESDKEALSAEYNHYKSQAEAWYAQAAEQSLTSWYKTYYRQIAQAIFTIECHQSQEWLNRATCCKILLITNNEANLQPLNRALLSCFPQLKENFIQAVLLKPVSIAMTDAANDTLNETSSNTAQPNLEPAATKAKQIKASLYQQLAPYAGNWESDLVVIAHGAEVSLAVLEVLRSEFKLYRDKGAVVILNELWNATKGYPWHKCRMVVYPATELAASDTAVAVLLDELLGA